jgi:uncharacterized protein RhaS with RHS repeats
VQKTVFDSGETTTFVYDAFGKSIAEYRNLSPPSNPKVAYLTQDNLGSPRINTDENGTVTARNDYVPYGEEIATSQRTVGLHYGGDNIRKKFTGYERDSETDLDYAQARMRWPHFEGHKSVSRIQEK